MNTATRTLVIINKTAARARRAWLIAQAALRESHIRFDVHETTHAGDATTTVRQALKAGYQMIGVIGGDGTLSEAAAGFFEIKEHEHAADDLPPPINRDATLAILPAGTGDDFARGLAGKREPIEQWIAAFIAHCRYGDEPLTRMVDVIAGSAAGGVRDFIGLNVVTIGLGAEVASRVRAQQGAMQHMPGEARYVAAAFSALAAWRERRVRVSVDESPAIDCSSNIIAVANGIYAGGGMMFAPAARIDDGQLNIIVGCGLTRAMILRELPRIRHGTHLSNPKVHTMSGMHIRIETFDAKDPLPVEADGNLRGHTPAEFRVIPSAIRVVTITKG